MSTRPAVLQFDSMEVRTSPIDALAAAGMEMIRGIHRSLVVLHNGSHGAGAGMVWPVSKPAGGAYILTNHHVVLHARSLRAALDDGREYPAQLVAEDGEIDLALLHVSAEGLPPVQVSESGRLRIGQLVWAVGHPWGQRGMVTAGLISSLTRAQTRGPRREIEIIRSDARLAPGNSGGPLVDASGGVVGINTLIIGGDQGMAIPSSLAAEFVGKVM